MKSKDEAANELKDYLKAVRDTWPGSQNWGTRQSLGNLEDKGIFWVIVNLFESFAKRIDNRNAQRSYVEFKNEFKFLSPINWGPDWTSMRAPERKRDLLFQILEYKINKAPPVGSPQFVPDTTLNDYIKCEPEKFDWARATRKLQKHSLSPISYPLTFEWFRPVNAYETAGFEIKQGDNILIQSEVRKPKMKLEGPPPVLKTSRNAQNVTISVSYTNHTEKYRKIELQMVP